MKCRIALTLFILVPGQVNRNFYLALRLDKSGMVFPDPRRFGFVFLLVVLRLLRVVNIIKHVFVSVSLVNIPKIECGESHRVHLCIAIK